ncbi:MAG: phage integrase N-terminal SAM-like domain-containing protein, partial [Bacteroidales bacterium]|nr:phage integrase N-terminal SAM-like domain-containing protein [Bacteroidales bacterium]
MDIKKDRIEGFEEFLSKLGTVPQDKVKYYIYWVRRFLKFSNYQLENINTERVSQYLDSLDANEKIADWQVKQAADAVILYIEKYLKRSVQHLTPQANDSKTQSTDFKGAIQWEQTLEEAKNTIRLRHFSLSTEKTYLGWIARFKTFFK